MSRGLIDMSSLIWTELLDGKDGEFGYWVTHNDKEKLVNSAAYGYEKCVEAVLKFMGKAALQPHQLIFVKEGMNSKAVRTGIHPLYKSGRDKIPEQYVEFDKCKEMLIDAFTSIGSSIVWQDGGIEADDVLGYIAQRLKGRVVVGSGDKDMAVLVGENIHHLRNGVWNENPFGNFPHRLIPVYIALVGDSGDKIPGAYGFGAAAWKKLFDAFGVNGLDVMHELIKNRKLELLAENVAELKELQVIIDKAEDVYMSYELGRLMVERVDGVRRPLQWRVGMVKPRAIIHDERLKPYGGEVHLVGAGQLAGALEWIVPAIEKSPFVSLDVETSTPEASDEWIARLDKDEGKEPVDVLGSELTSLQITFGPNLQYTVYLPVANVEEPDVKNLTIAQVRDVVNLIPSDKVSWVHNASFELPVCYMAWGKDWAEDPEYHGFLRNVRDTAIASSYVNENRSRGLKSLSLSLLGHQQMDYQTVTTKSYRREDWSGKGKLIGTWWEDAAGEVVTPELAEVTDGDGVVTLEPVLTGLTEWVKVQHKMNQLKARQVLSYGADDTICTAALAVHFLTVMELEDTHHVFEAVETFPAYLTALAYVQGTEFSLDHMGKMEAEDNEAYDKAWPVLRDYLMKIGFEGTVCPQMLTDAEALAYLEANDKFPSHLWEFSAKGIKETVKVVLGQELTTQVRTPSKLAKLIEDLEVDPEIDETGTRQATLVKAINEKDIPTINALIASRFTGEPVLDLASPTQMCRLLYDHMKLPVRIINDVTPDQRKKQPELAQAVRKFKQIRNGRSGVSLDDNDLALIRKKAKADETAIDFALAFDTTRIDDEARAALNAIGTMKKVLTRRSLFYKNYWVLQHWKDRKIHASANQCAAVTRRYSMANPNLQQLPKKGKGARFRGCFKPHKKNAVICSIDFVAQELRLAAWRSQDKNMLACYIGEKLKDIHSITAAGALKMKWGNDLVNELFDIHGPDLTRDAEGTYDLFIRLRKLGIGDEIGKRADDHRKSAKNVNFAAQNGAGAAKISETEVMPFEDSKMFLEARESMFPAVGEAADRAARVAQKTGRAYTLMGAIRHLRDAMMSEEDGAADRAARQAWNFEIQGSAGEQTKLAMSLLWTTGAYFKFDARFIAPIHDELVDSVTDEDAVEFIKLKHWCMTRPYADMAVPVLGSISIGPDFHQQIECGDDFDEAAIRKALDKIFKRETADV